MTETTQLITRVDFVNVPTTDLERARKFYGETLGLEASQVYQRGDSPAMGAEFEAGNLTLAVVDVNALNIEFRSNVVPIAFHVDDVDAARGELEQRGVEFGPPTLDTGVCHMAFFKDPDGNALMLHSRYAPAS